MDFKNQKIPAVFLDRDGTINEEVGYLNHPSRLRILKGVPQALKKLQEAGFKLFVVTNQSGPARGYFPYELVDKIHELIKKRLSKYGVEIAEFLVCLHHPSENCPCRKPKIGLIEKALSLYPIDISKSYVIGDRLIDVELALNSGIKGILVLTGYGKGELEFVLPQRDFKPHFIAKNLLEAVNFILKDLRT
ncbi:MAG: HAD family hydrolase [Thermodesulfobacteriaceae bacterium]|nr:HAD family hydrolase [Thermodesulfobacteriaceae bacterium]MCX8041451.1 HAD family hydrolase [Thermodesulfobacteriaceae bacterium]MDW8135766.1 HAD family hydrolase [Thermodesulfobacterium sp.]